ncbi:PDZ domain-containing protein [Flavobacterium macacae]|uniref:Signal protein PDZ n=1 Tax=Flavobacterium macacae TaxID=2488993 RepID=A0A3P3W5H2_9FLAO|nr:PDZ domain-containing protein [Flavobacterium macacae]RRJ89226.1 signal protein PDZ [Flavobacterium macacae]
MMAKRFSFLFLLTPILLLAQNSFEWTSKKEKISIDFKLVSNLIILPVKINNVELNMILDTGSESSIIFSLPENDSIEFRDVKKIFIRGLGETEKIEALYSVQNKLDLSGYKTKNFPLLIVLNQDINISERLGVEVNGILNSSFFKGRIIEIDYIKKKMLIHKNGKKLKKKRLDTFEIIPVRIVKERPYVNLDARINEIDVALNLLVDIGLSDGLWLFEKDKIKSNANYFEDVLGRGLNGEIVGKKSRVDRVQIANFEFKDALVSYPYSKFFPLFQFSEERNGSIGAGILYRFHLIFDYEQNRILIYPNSKFSEPFNYNMSGLEIQHNGVEYFNEKVPLATSKLNSSQNLDVLANGTEKFLYKFILKPVFEVATIQKDSPAALAGILVGDKIKRINKKNIQRYSLQQINEMMRSEEGKWIYIDIERKGVSIAFKFQLKKII